MNSATQLRNDIAASIFLKPCTFDELVCRDFVKGKDQHAIWNIIQSMLRRGILYGDPDELLKTNKKWAMENLSDYELDFRTPKQKWLESLSDFAKALYRQGLIDYPGRKHLIN